MSSHPTNIIFMGTPEFAVAPLKALLEEGFNISAVITAPDKPAGRGKKMTSSAIKEFALSRGLTVLQPEKLKDPSFLDLLHSFKPDLQVVVAFRMLPEQIWSLPPLGTFNLHASLLPQYRGAAPINHVIMNGEKETGVTTFFIDEKIDTGKILFQEKVRIPENYTAEDLHDKLMETGASLVLKTVRAIISGNFKETPQEALLDKAEILHPAPKIFKEDCKINWNLGGYQIQNLIRGLSPSPAAITCLKGNDGTTINVKIFKAVFLSESHELTPGSIIIPDKKKLYVAVKDGYISVKSLQLAGKSQLDTNCVHVLIIIQLFSELRFEF
jgi:methionyl-tRNA formyltransferase